MGRESVAMHENAKAALTAHNENPIIADICEANGISKEDFAFNRCQVETIELFLMDLPTMKPVSWFPSLVKLQVMHQDISVIEGLDQLVSLEYLWLNENHIGKLQGLQQCTRLKELYLHSNRITKIEGFDNLSRLQVLWLQDNQLTSLDGLSKLTSLRVLWVASNKISTIGHFLDANTSLEELNLSGNLIGSFRQIPHLDRLTRLTHLYFSDPHFGDNPICQLCNYQTYTLYHLNRIKVLDYNAVSDESRHLAEATFVKKKMYYNMRIKTLRRNTSNLVRKAVQFRQTRLSEVNLSLNVLIRMAKELEREVDEQKNLPPLPEDTDIRSPAPVPELENKLEVVGNTVRQKHAEIDEIDQRFSAMKESIETISQDNISRLLVELQTGGNIRMEEGKVSDVWYQSCMDLVKTRFFGTDFEAFGMKDVRITKVTRIHNRFLRNRFEDRLDLLVDTSNQAYKRALEYLFYGEDPELNGELTSAIERGFLSPSEYESFGKDGGIPLTNSVFLSEQSRLVKLHRQGLLAQKREDGISGRLLITKVFLGKCCPERERAEANTGEVGPFTPLIASRQQGGHSVKRKDYPGSVGSVYRAKPGDTKQRVWMCFDHHVILPEYLVEFMYIPIVSPQRAPGGNRLSLSALIDYSTDERLDELQEVINKLVPTKSELDASDVRSYAHFFLSFIHQCNTLVHADKELSCELLSTSPIPQQRPKISAVTPQLIQTVARCDELAQVTYLNFFGNHIRKIEHVQDCTQLRVLVLSFNEIQRIEGIQNLPHLTHLDLSFNLIKRVEGLRNLPSLEKLALNNNLIYRLEDVNVIKKTVPSVTDLSLLNNAICDVKSYRYIVLRRVPGLKYLDGTLITEDDIRAAQDKLYAMTPTLVASHTHTQPTLGWALNLQPNLGCEDTGEGYWRDTVNESEDNGLHVLKELEGSLEDPDAGEDSDRDNENDLSGSDDERLRPNSLTAREEAVLVRAIEVNCPKMRIRKIQSLDRCRDLRRLNVSDNEINRIEGLENCQKLEELYLDDNRIIKIENLNLLVNLRKLELGKNKINKIEGLEALPHLCQVCHNYFMNSSQLAMGVHTPFQKRPAISLVRRKQLQRSLHSWQIVRVTHKLHTTPQVSLEDNDIYSLQGIQKVQNLMELYIGNNKIDNLKEIHYLREAPKLIILDLSGNPLCFEHEYRLFTVFNLKKLKVLDGVGIDANESMKAKETFAGKMSSELVTEKVGKMSDWASVTELNISSCSIRELSLLDHLPSLLHLKCDHNLLSDLSGLRSCNSLLSLNLNGNRISTPDPMSQPTAHHSVVIPLGKCLEHMLSLESLSLEGNQITSISGLSLKQPNLRFLNLRSNDISRVDGLDFVPHLCELILDRNRLRALEDKCFTACTGLKDLRAEENMIKTLDGLKSLSSLRRLFLTANRVSDLSELEKVEVSERLTEVYFTANAVARKSLYRPTLIHKLPGCLVIDGREVSVDEREKAEFFFNQEYYAYQHPPNVYTDRPLGAAGAAAGHQPTVMGPKGTVKLVSFEYHDTPSPAPLYHNQADLSKVQGAPFRRGASQVWLCFELHRGSTHDDFGTTTGVCETSSRLAAFCWR
ncbi:Protein phosphatase 1 regulatory subunit SDS22-like protein [Diplonema papillatum]|nr:Protein phosphatase 1 regulatory subunit SDS22-like protein [Diplonema papillatum]